MTGTSTRAHHRSARRGFWTAYQPGFRVSDAPLASPEFFAEVEADRYSLEPAIEELARFESWANRDVLEAGCGIASDGMRFVRAGARYTGLDFSPVALDVARRRLELEGGSAGFVSGDITDLPFPSESFDLVYSNGVIHHVPDTARAVNEFHRVLRPGGTALVMVYHRSSFNYFFTIMLLRRLLAGLLLIPGAERAVAWLTGEPVELLRDHKRLLRKLGGRYLTDPATFLSRNTDGPANPLSKVYTRRSGSAFFDAFDSVTTEVRFLILRTYPLGERIARARMATALERRWGWHLWIRAIKA